MEQKVKIQNRISAVIHGSGNSPTVIALHGFESFKDSPKYILMGENFEKNGFTFIRFDFSGCGETPGDKFDLEKRIEDVGTVYEFAKRFTNHNKIYFIGSSLGGTIAILLGELADGIVALCPPIVNIGKLKIEDSLKRNPPLLIIHGDKDETVPIEEGMKIFELARPPKEFFKIPGGDHRFSNPDHLAQVIEKSVNFIKKLNEK